MPSESEFGDDEESGFFKRMFLIPCMRESLMNGISGGLATGLGHFLFTSNGSKSFNLGIGGCVAFLWGTWAVCRYQKFKVWQQQNSSQNAQEFIRLDPKDV